jgi:hypothetical protein
MMSLILVSLLAPVPQLPPETPWDLMRTVKEDNWIASSRLLDDYHNPDKGEKEWKGETVGFIAEVGSVGTDSVGRPTLILNAITPAYNQIYTCVLDRKETKEVHKGQWVLIRGEVGRKLLIHSTRIIFVEDTYEAVKKQSAEEFRKNRNK